MRRLSDGLVLTQHEGQSILGHVGHCQRAPIFSCSMVNEETKEKRRRSEEND